MKCKLYDFFGYFDEETFHKIQIVKNGKIYFDLETGKILLAHYFLQNWEKFVKLGYSGDFLFRSLFNMVSSNEFFRFDSNSHELETFPLLSDLLTAEIRSTL